MTWQTGLVAELLWVSWRDYRAEARISLCYVLALVAVLAPLMVASGLKYGVIDTLTQRLVQRPEARALIPVGHRDYDAAFFAALATDPDTGFVVPSTRRIAASLNLVISPRTGTQARDVQLIPSATGDPLLADGGPAPVGLAAVVISHTLAKRLDATVGERLEARLARRRDERNEVVPVPLEVAAILPARALSQEAMLVSLELLEATEDYRDGLEVPSLGWVGRERPAAARRYPRFRLYAATIGGVAALESRLAGLGVEVQTRSAEIASLQSLETNLDRIFWLLATLAGVGFLASLAASLVANVERKRRELAVLRLIGFSARLLPLFPVFQGLFTALLGIGLATLTYLPIAVALNLWFASDLRNGEQICRLPPGHLMFAFLITCLGAIVASAWAGRGAARIEPASAMK